MTVTHEVPLPGLRGDRPHEFVAGLGVLRLLAQEAGYDETRLRWDGSGRSPSTTAVLTTRLPDVAAVGDVLHGVADGIDPAGVLPGMPPDWPPGRGRGGAGGGDPAQAYPPAAADVAAVSSTGVEWWSACLVADRNYERVRRSPYIARRGQQTLRSFFAAPLSYLRERRVDLAQTVADGTRVDGYGGELLDATAYASDGPLRGDPGATWLAAMALPLLAPSTLRPFPGGVEEGRVLAPGWRVAPTGEAVMVWPLWHPPLDIHAAQVMLSHPGWAPGSSVDFDEAAPEEVDQSWQVDPAAAAGLGVWAVYEARRHPVRGSKYDRPLHPSRPVPLAEPVEVL